MTIGFTGSRNGMTDEQKEQVSNTIDMLLKQTLKGSSAIDGRCVGSDADFNDIATEKGLYTIGIGGYSAKNPDDLSYRNDNVYNVYRTSMTHFARNREIVNASDVMIATPLSFNFDINGGTNYTIKFAQQVKKPIYVISPEGIVKTFNV